MAVEQDQSIRLPEPPPPHPARREAAIEAALRGFDGTEEAAPVRERPRRSWAATHRPQLAGLMTAALLLVVAIPATFIGLRTQESGSEHAPTGVVADKSGCAGNDCAQKRAVEPAPGTNAEVQEAADAEVTAPAAVQSPGETNEPAATEKVAAEAAPSTPPAAPVIAAAPPPPPAPGPAPPPPPAASVAGAEGTVADSIVVTGSRAKAQLRPNATTAEADAGPAYADFLSRLQSAVRRDDRRAVMRLIAFPLRVNGAGGTRFYSNARSLERDFDRVFTPQVRQAILGQRADRLFVRDKGAMIGEGEVWFDQICSNASCSPPGPVRIIAVNR